MTFEEFLSRVRASIGNKATSEYWKAVYNAIEDKSREWIEKEMPFMLVRGVGVDYASKNEEIWF